MSIRIPFPEHAPPGQPDGGIGGDVMALVGPASGLGTGTVIPALPEAGDLTRLRVREEAGHVDDLRISWRSQRHLDHLDPEQGGVGILIRVESPNNPAAH